VNHVIPEVYGTWQKKPNGRPIELKKIKSDRHKNERRGRIVSELPIAVNRSCFSREGRPQSPGWRIRRKNGAFPTTRGTAVLPDEQEFKDERPSAILRHSRTNGGETAQQAIRVCLF
jgi:hypothetical protein